MSTAYLIKDVRVLNSRSVFESDIRVKNGSILEIGLNLSARRDEIVLDCSGLTACPGLINAHDHLQFNLYSRIGNPPYINAYDWGNDIRTTFRSTVDAIERIPIHLRYRWGAWKNLFSGVTRVVHHDPYSLYCRYLLPVDIQNSYTFAHSLGNEKHLERALTRRRRDVPFIIHLAEGTDELTAREVESLMRLGGLDERTVAVHAININQRDIDLLAAARASVVWCPTSNRYLFDQTAPVDALWGRISVALGTDSTLTGSCTMFEEMRAAAELSTCSPQDVFQMVTEIPRAIFKLPSWTGQIVEGGRADLFIIPSNETDPYRAVLDADPGTVMLMMKRGEILYYDAATVPVRQSYIGSPVLFRGRKKVVMGGESDWLFRMLRPFLGHYAYLEGN